MGNPVCKFIFKDCVNKMQLEMELLENVKLICLNLTLILRLSDLGASKILVNPIN